MGLRGGFFAFLSQATGMRGTVWKRTLRSGRARWRGNARNGDDERPRLRGWPLWTMRRRARVHGPLLQLRELRNRLVRGSLGVRVREGGPGWVISR